MDSEAPSLNRFLAGLPAEDVRELQPRLEHVAFPHRHILHEAHSRIEHAYLPEVGMISLLLPLEEEALLEVGVVGSEGFVGLSAVLGADTAPHTAMVQIPGKGARIEVGLLRKRMQKSAALLRRVHLYAHAFQIQVSRTAACNARHNLQERLARWILMAHDRGDSDVLPLTQEFMSMMLGVRRAGVTVAVNTLEASGAIIGGHGRVTVADRQRLEGAACGCYKRMTEEVGRVLG